MKFSDPRPPTKLFFLALLVRFKVPITNFFYFLIQLYTSRNWRFGKNFFDSDQKRFFYDFFVFEICRHFVPPFALVSSRLDWSRFKNSYSSQAKWFGCIFLDRGKYTVENAWEMCRSMLKKVADPKKNQFRCMFFCEECPIKKKRKKRGGSVSCWRGKRCGFRGRRFI